MKKLIVEIKNNEEVLMSLKDELTSVSFGALDRGNVEDTTNWGVFSNIGNIDYIDKTNRFASIISTYPDLDVCIYYSSKDTQKKLATFNVDDFSYNNETSLVSLKLKDVLIDWQNKIFGEYYAFYGKYMIDILRDNFSSSQIEIQSSAKFKMMNYFANVSYMMSSTEWSRIEKICQASMMRCFCDEKGIPIIADEDSKLNSEKIYIRPKNILSIESVKSNKKTKINDVSLSAFKYTVMKDKSILANKDGINFSWFKTNGTRSGQGDIDGIPLGNRYIIAEWNNSIETSRYVVGLTQKTGARAIAKNISLVDHIYKFNHSDITANFSTNDDLPGGAFTITKETRTTNEEKANENGWGIYELTRASIYHEDPFDSTSGVNILVEDDRAIDLFTLGGEIHYSEGEPVGHYVVTDLNVNWTGDFFKEDGEKIFGSKGKFATILQSNELIQVDSISKICGDTPLAQYIVDTTKEKYSNGVECVIIEVTPSEYYSESGLNNRNTLFEKYDVVVPYVIRNGVEQPYSRMEDGTPKSFKIVGIEYDYKGFLRQKLHLQENVGNYIKYSFIKPYSVVYSTSSKGTIFPWFFSGLEANKTYTVSWSMKKSVLDQLTMYKDDRGNFRYYNYDKYTLSTCPVSKEIYDLLNFTVDVSADDEGRIYIGSLFANHVITSGEEASELIGFIEKNTNHILAFEKQP